jgi:hypothetical protein
MQHAFVVKTVVAFYTMLCFGNVAVFPPVEIIVPASSDAQNALR